MINWYLNCNVVGCVLIASLFTWFITSLGSAIVFFFKKVNSFVLDTMLAISGGIMLAAAIFSLLIPSIDSGNITTTSIGFILGGLLLIVGDIIFDKYLTKKKSNNIKGIKRSLMLIFSITLHNIPEGLAIGVAFGTKNNLIGATILAIGIGIQNFPEGSAISLPLRREGLSRTKSFLYGFLSGIVEPISALLGFYMVTQISNILPLLLAFAAGAMIYVVVSELVPECEKSKYKNLMSLLFLIGFVIMMLLDVIFG